MAMEIIPAILPQDFAEIEEKVNLLKEVSDIVQIDICDGHFVSSFTWPYKKKDNTFEQIIREDEALPAWQTVNYEFDLMVDHPEKVVDDWVSVGAARIIIHVESKGDIKEAINKLVGRVEVGLALNIDTRLDVIKDLVGDDAVQFVQLMGIDHIGFQGQEFDEKVIQRIEEVREMYPDMLISIDGGVSLENAAVLLDAGADRLVVGSAIFAAENPLDAIEKFQAI